MEKEDWTAWHEERTRFFTRETEGFTKDSKAFKQHIKNLTELCPKDKAGWPVRKALIVLDEMTISYSKIKNYLDQVTPGKRTHYD